MWILIPIGIVLSFAALCVSLGVLLMRGHIDMDSWLVGLPWKIGVALTLIFVVLLSWSHRVVQRAKAEANANSITAIATVTAVRDPGPDFDGRPRLELWLRVSPRDGPPFDAVSTVATYSSTAHRFHTGSQLLVRYDNNDHSRVVVDE